MRLLAKIIIVIAVFFGGFYFGQQQALSPSNGSSIEERQQQVEEEISVSLMLDFGNGQVMTQGEVKLAEGSTVLDLLEKVTTENNFELQSRDYGEMGAFVEAIGGIENDASSDRFWQYWVNNEYAQVGVSAYKLVDGDVVEWKFIKGQIN